MRFRKAFSYLLFLSFLIIASCALAQDQNPSYEQYLSDLNAQGRERVIVQFKETIDYALVEKYEGKIIRVLSIINAIVCEIPNENIEPLRKEKAIENIGVDKTIKTDMELFETSNAERDEFMRLKREYLRKVKLDYCANMRNITQGYLASVKECLDKRKAITALYNEANRLLKKANKKDRAFYLKQLDEYCEALKKCETLRKQALRRYQESMRSAKAAHELAAVSWYANVIKTLSSYEGGAAPQWENLDTGLNAKAAWDRYGLDGNGIKVAFLDTGINYCLADLGGGIGPGFKCLGGHNYFAGDPDDPTGDPDNPMPYIDPYTYNNTESHGTSIAANCLGKGADKVVGMAYNASYYSLRILKGHDGMGPLSNAIAAIEWCMDPDGNPGTVTDRPDIINMSFGAYGDESNPEILLFKAACDVAYNAGIILVAGSGNDGYEYSLWPAAFKNVISVGGHAVDQTLLYREVGTSITLSNGGVDIIAPGEYLATLLPENIVRHSSGTSGATACASGALALMMQYARDNHIRPNNGYLWELLKHSAKDMPLISDPNYKGAGKIWVADTAPAAPDMGDGGIDCIAAKWPLNYSFVYANYAYIDGNGHPAYYIGTSLYYDVSLMNNTNTAGSHACDIENIDVTATQAYYQAHDEANMPGSPIETFPRQFAPPAALTSGSNMTLSDTYYIPTNTYCGLDRIILNLGFEFSDDTNNRLIKVTYPYASIWCPPPLINEGFPVE